MDIDGSNVVSNNVIGSYSQVSITQNIVHTQDCAVNPIPHQLPLVDFQSQRNSLNGPRVSAASATRK